MNRCAKIAFCSIVCVNSLFSLDSLTYGIEVGDGELIRKSLRSAREKDVEALFQSDLGEKVASAYIQEAVINPIVSLRLEGILAALHGNNSKSVLVLEKALYDPHPGIRAFARKAALHFFDRSIQKKCIELAKTKRGEEKIEAFGCLASQDKDQALQLANAIFDNPETPLFEKTAIGQLLSSSLLFTKRPLLPTLESHMLSEDILLWSAVSNPSCLTEDTLTKALVSSSFLSQRAALSCLGLWGCPNTPPFIHAVEALLHSSNLPLRLKAAWVAYLHVPQLHEEACSILKMLSQGGEEEAELVSKVLSSSGSKTVELAQILFKDPDVHPLCRVNACVQLMRHRSYLEQAPFELLQVLKNVNRPLQCDEQQGDMTIIFAKEGDAEIEQQWISQQDSSVRCYLLGLVINTSDNLAVESLAYKFAENLLKKKSWGPLFESGSQLFLQVGPKSLAFVRKLAQSFHEEVRIQAAGLLASLHSEQEALELIKNELPLCTFEGKMTIVALMPFFSFHDALPILISSMQDTSSLLRVRAAGMYLYLKYA